MTRTSIFRAVVAIVLLATASQAATVNPAVRVSLHPAVISITPGTAFDLAIRFNVPDGWHIYWSNPGDSGLPTRVNWKLPPGFEPGELRFPVPKRHAGPGGLLTNILEGEPVLLQSVTASRSLKPGGRVTLVADIQWLACKTSCVPGRVSLSVELPVGKPTADLDPADKAIIEMSHRALPIPANRSKHVKVSPSTTMQAVTPGQSFEVVLDVEIGSGEHVQSNQPPLPTFIPTHVYVERDQALSFGKTRYPPPEERRHPQFGKLSEYRGKLKIRLPVQVRDDAAGTRVLVAGVLTSQACNDKTGTCYPPEHVAWALELPLQGASAAAPAGSEVATPIEAATTEYALQPGADGVAQATTDGDWLQRFLAQLGLPGLLLGCFLYGLFINATPCVLPLLSIKVLGFVQQAHESRSRTLLLGLAFGVGVVLFFVVLGFLAAAGRNILQYPVAVIALGAVVMALALSMLGVYTLQVPTTATKLEAGIQKEGVLSSFGKGALAPVLGFACTGPLLAGVFGWATQQPPRIAVFSFLFAGLGMASPYMLLGANPHWLSFLPKPGNWMITFERIMGFLLLGMVVWLLHPLVTHMGVEGLEWTLGFLVVIALACWLLGRIDVNMPTARRRRYRSVAAALVLGAGALVYGVIYPPDMWHGARSYQNCDDWSDGIPWRPWSLRETVVSGKTVFVDFTAAYCTVCKQNKAMVINTPEVRAKMEALGVVPMRGDFTSGDPEIAAMLKRFQRAGVPLNLIYPAGQPDQPILLRTNLTKEYLLKKLDAANGSERKLKIENGEEKPSRDRKGAVETEMLTQG